MCPKEVPTSILFIFLGLEIEKCEKAMKKKNKIAVRCPPGQRIHRETGFSISDSRASPFISVWHIQSGRIAMARMDHDESLRDRVCDL